MIPFKRERDDDLLIFSEVEFHNEEVTELGDKELQSNPKGKAPRNREAIQTPQRNPTTQI